jgi:hypothetical protein
MTKRHTLQSVQKLGFFFLYNSEKICIDGKKNKPRFCIRYSFYSSFKNGFLMTRNVENLQEKERIQNFLIVKHNGKKSSLIQPIKT